MNLGIIDIGSNTIRLAVYDTETNKKIADGVDYAGLIAYVADGKISFEGKEILCGAVLKLKKVCEENNCQRIKAFATASLRDIEDKEALISEILLKTGVDVEIISGEREAYFDYLGLKSMYNEERGAAFDLGGGSAQLITFAGGKVTGYTSKKIGALRLYKDFVTGTFPTSEEEKKMRTYIAKSLGEFKSENNNFAFAMGGAAGAIKKLSFALTGENKERFSIDYLSELSRLPENVINSIVPERLYTIKPALIAIEEICRVLKTNEIFAVKCGVRDGVLCEEKSRRI